MVVDYLKLLLNYYFRSITSIRDHINSAELLSRDHYNYERINLWGPDLFSSKNRHRGRSSRLNFRNKYCN